MCCIDDGPVDNDPYAYGANRMNTFETTMMNSCCANPCGFLGALICYPCMICYIRKKALADDMTQYTCCQGYFNCMCWTAGNMGEESCPELCLCAEALCCPSCAISANRIYVMDMRNLQSDPCDRRIIRFNNFMQMLSCICDCAAIFVKELRDVARCIDQISNIVYCLTQACMQAQTHHELKLHPAQPKHLRGGAASAPPNYQQMGY